MSKVDTRAWDAMCRDLSRMTAAPFAKVVDYEAARTLEKTMAGIQAAKVELIKRRFANATFSAQPETIYTPRTTAGLLKRAKARRVHGKLLYSLAYKYPDELWAAIQHNRTASLKAKLKARGLAKQAIAQIANQLGLEMRRPGYVDKAKPSTGRTYRNTTTRRVSTAARYGIAFENRQPTAVKLGGQRILQRAIDGRVKYFERNLAKHVFDNAAQIARRYPGVKTK